MSGFVGLLVAGFLVLMLGTVLLASFFMLAGLVLRLALALLFLPVRLLGWFVGLVAGAFLLLLELGLALAGLVFGALLFCGTLLCLPLLPLLLAGLLVVGMIRLLRPQPPLRAGT